MCRNELNDSEAFVLLLARTVEIIVPHSYLAPAFWYHEYHLLVTQLEVVYPTMVLCAAGEAVRCLIIIMSSYLSMFRGARLFSGSFWGSGRSITSKVHMQSVPNNLPKCPGASIEVP